MSDDDLHVRLMLGEPTIAKLTKEAVADALDGFPLRPTKGVTWLARAIQGALYVSLGNASDGPERQSNSDNRAELERLSNAALGLWSQLFEISGDADSALWDFAWRRWNGEGGKQVDGFTIGEPSDYKAFSQAVRQLDWLARFLRDAAKAQITQPPKWRDAERRERRIFRAQCLAPIFEKAFELESVADIQPEYLGYWPDFYERICRLAFGEEKGGRDLEGVLDEARRRHKQDGVTFSSGIIPE